jgi:hypothetical protein
MRKMVTVGRFLPAVAILLVLENSVKKLRLFGNFPGSSYTDKRGYDGFDCEGHLLGPTSPAC